MSDPVAARVVMEPLTAAMPAVLPALLAQTIVWSGRIAGIAVATNALELLSLHAAFGVRGVWRDVTLSASWGSLRVLLISQRFRLLMMLQLAMGLGLVWAAGTRVGGVCAVVSTFTTLLAAMRFRGTVNGGSDGMLFTVLAGLSVAQLAPLGSSIGEAGILYVAAQLTLSYLRAGLVKVRQPGWWNGQSLAAFLSLPAYGVPSWIPRQQRLLRGAGLAVILWECLAPLVWLSPQLSVAYICIGVAFHTAVALTFGLNRFVWAWGAALPTLWYVANRLG